MRKRTKKRSILFKVIMPIVCLVVGLVLWVGIDLIINVSIKEAPRRPTTSYNFTELYELLWLYDNKESDNPNIDYTLADVTEEKVLNAISPAAEYISHRYDCSDFRAIDLLKLLYDGGNDLLSLSEDSAIGDMLEDTLVNFKFWITSEGDDSMCYYSENHIVLFGVVEYLSGYAYPHKIFSIDGKNGLEHMEIAKTRLLEWLDLRYTYGFSEIYSNNYYPVNLAALTMLIRYMDKDDTELLEKAKIVLDLLFLDYAMQLYDYTFMSPAGRSYAYNNNHWDSTLSSYIIVDHVWDINNYNYEDNIGGFGFLTVSNLKAKDSYDNFYYEVPQVIIDIGRETSKTIKTSTGVNLSEYIDENLLGHSDRQMMFQLGMGAISNPEVIQNTLDYINKYDLLSNNFLSNFKYTNIKLFQMLGLMPLFSEKVQPLTNGFANQRYNIYTHITEHYKMSTSQKYFPGSFGSQQIQNMVNLPNNISIFTSHPMDAPGQTPGYWAGYGFAPHSVQDENIALMIYNLPKDKIAFASSKPLNYTHTYFPKELFDEVIIEGNYAFGRINNTYIALIGTSELSYLPYDATTLETFKTLPTEEFDLVQYGKEHAWIYEISSLNEDGDFAAFMSRIKANSISFTNNQLSYISNEKSLSVKYNGNFSINGSIISTEYKRVESQYVTVDRKPDTYTIVLNDKTLFLDFANYNRVYD